MTSFAEGILILVVGVLAIYSIITSILLRITKNRNNDLLDCLDYWERKSTEYLKKCEEINDAWYDLCMKRADEHYERSYKIAEDYTKAIKLGILSGAIDEELFEPIFIEVFKDKIKGMKYKDVQ